MFPGRRDKLNTKDAPYGFLIPLSLNNWQKHDYDYYKAKEERDGNTSDKTNPKASII
jgi:hypothetical protein